MTRKQRRLTLIAAALAVLGVALGLVLFAMRDNIVFFYSPTDLEAKAVTPGTRLRLGGLVAEGSVEKGEGQNVTFAVTDTNRSITVRYTGLLPDLFREGQGVVTEGVLESAGLFRADSVLAKHDENYMPREVADSLKAQGLWQHGGKTDAQDGGATAASE
ncbi:MULTISPECIES: cytochrome c maturation protein CcmE [Chelatococcus]|uniref:Cytochrome c-type biogenesis protein CcmE n=1 Tax=Chelatococcus caeni TaxID=1348468 RepID=A0A840BVS6_9HYPH|nr:MULTISPECIES: cytochrome c maturation protein CcmE [unclassified Chelatococcus]ALA18312.1 CyCJ cytochrome-c biosynthesis protein [Chelatococcus sp. CO-6]MBB4015459.1 cytochrome c-type biogenesis protein CcmE [Chelatococcus caeni]